MFSGGGALTQGTGYTGGGRAAESGKQPGNTTCAAAETAAGGGGLFQGQALRAVQQEREPRGEGAACRDNTGSGPGEEHCFSRLPALRCLLLANPRAAGPGQSGKCSYCDTGGK